MKRRTLLGGSAAWATLPLSITVSPPSAGMTATVALPAQTGYKAGSYVFAEASGTQLADWVDPRGAFTLALRQVTNPGLPGFRVIFVRSRDGKWASVEMWLGDATVTAAHLSNGYAVAVSGDFAGQSSTPVHWWGGRWRLSGSAANGLRPGRNDWPYALTSYATLLADHLIPQFDPNVMVPGGPASVPAVPPYTPMGSSALQTYMPGTGGRSDLGIFTEWDAYYFQAQAPTASAALRALTPQALTALTNINEAGASIPWFVYDPAHGCLWELIANNAGKDRPGMPYSGSRMPLVCTGPAGAAVTTSVSDSVHQDNWWVVPNSAVIPASGKITVTADSGGGGALKPAGSPIATGGGSAAVTYAWGDPSLFQAGSMWAIDAAHEPTLGYLPYILFRDPWDLHTIQASALWSAAPTFWVSQTRQAAWDYTHAALAWAATPAVVPAWLIPKATLEIWKARIRQWVLDNAIAGPGKGSGVPQLATVFHSVQAGRQPGAMPDSYALCNNTINISGDSLMDAWEDAMFAQAAALASLLEPSSADARTVAQYAAHAPSDRRDGTTGWPQTVNTPYRMRWRPDNATPAYATWAAAWAGNAALQLGKCPPDPMTPPAVYDASHDQDYGAHDFAAVSLAVQAGLSQFKPARDFLAGRFAAVSSVNSNRAFAQV